MRRVVVTGLGVVSSIGSTAQEVTASLREAKSGIAKSEEYERLGFKCQVAGSPKLDWSGMVPRKPKRFMNEGMGWNYVAMDQAIRDAGLDARDIVNERTGIIMGSGGPSTHAIVGAADVTRSSGSPKKIGPFEVSQAVTLERLAELVGAEAERTGALGSCWIPFDEIPLPFGEVTADTQQEQRIRHGQTVLVRELAGEEGDWVKLLNRRREMIAVGTVIERIGAGGVGIVQPKVVFR